MEWARDERRTARGAEAQGLVGSEKLTHETMGKTAGPIKEGSVDKKDHARTEGREDTGILEGKAVSRRDFLKIAGVAGATIGMGAGLGGLVAACGSTATTTTGATTATTAASTASTAAPVNTTVTAAVETGREIKIGFPSPQTGAIATFGVPDGYCADRWKAAVGDGLVCGDGKKHPVTFILRDTQSDSNRVAQVAGELLTSDKVDILIAASSPETVCPAADQAEGYSTPGLFSDCADGIFLDQPRQGPS